MGFRLQERTGRISFEGTPYDGAEVVVRLNVTLGLYRRVVELQESGDLDAVIEIMCGLITEWNLEDDAGAIPVSPEGFDRLEDLGFLTALMQGWDAAMRGETQVPAPLGERSSSGSMSTSATPSGPPEAS